MLTEPSAPSAPGVAWFRPEAAAAPPHRVLEPSGDLAPGAEAVLTADEAQQALELMMLSRAYDERATALNRQGLFGGFAPATGQEACLVGSALALDPARDWIVPQYRELPALVRHGYPLERLAAFSLGKTDAAAVPEGVRVLPLQFSLAAELPHAVGLAWGRALQCRDEVVLAYCGEGATSEGDFHEACNLAGVLALPVVFLVQDNGWAITTPRRLQTAALSLAVRAVGYGFRGVVVDGNDLLAVAQVARLAVEHARSGAGPVLVEARTYRVGLHNMTDDPRRYRPQAEVDEARRLDPIARVQRYLASTGAWDDGRAEAVHRRVSALVDEAIERARRMPGQRPGDVFDHVFAEPTANLAVQRRRALGQP